MSQGQKRIKLPNQDFGIKKPKLLIKIESRVSSVLGFYFFLLVYFHWREKAATDRRLQSQYSSL